MRTLALLLLCGLAGAAGAQSIEGYWQDTERRILFSRDAPAGYVYGRWTALDQAQTYPSAKQFRRSGSGFEVLDLLYDDEEVVKVGRSSDQGISSPEPTPGPGAAHAISATWTARISSCASSKRAARRPAPTS